MNHIEQKAQELCVEIEKLPAGEQQTKVSLLAVDLSKAIAQVPGTGEVQLLAAFDKALEQQPFLMFEIGYTRVTDWMVHIWNKSGGKERKIVSTQHPDRNECCQGAADKLHQLIEFSDPLLQ